MADKPGSHLHQNLNDDLSKLLTEVLKYKKSTDAYLTDAAKNYDANGRKMIDAIKATHERFCKHMERQYDIVQQAIDRDFKEAITKLDMRQVHFEEKKKKNRRESDSVRELALGTRERLRTFIGASSKGSSPRESTSARDNSSKEESEKDDVAIE